MTYTLVKCYSPYISKMDPCPPMLKKCFSTPPNLYIPFQPYNSEQFPTAREALYKGTLWTCLYDPYPLKREENLE